MYKKFTVAALLLLGCFVSFAFFVRHPQAIASPILQQNTPTPAPEEEAATSGELTHQEALTATVATEAAEPTLPDLIHHIKDLQAQISVAGVYAAGDMTTLARQVISAAAQGATAAVAIHTDLLAEDYN